MGHRAHIGISLTKFDELVVGRRMSRPVKIDSHIESLHGTCHKNNMWRCGVLGHSLDDLL
jgi:hypothetical protein